MTSFIWKIEHIECVPPREAGADIWMILYFIHNTVLCKSQFIEINISYKISVNYCSIKMQIVVIFLFHISKTFSNVELLSIYSQSFLELIFATKAKTMLLKQSAVSPAVKKILHILCVWTLKIFFTNKRILT